MKELFRKGYFKISLQTSVSYVLHNDYDSSIYWGKFIGRSCLFFLLLDFDDTTVQKVFLNFRSITIKTDDTWTVLETW